MRRWLKGCFGDMGTWGSDGVEEMDEVDFHFGTSARKAVCPSERGIACREGHTGD